MQLLRSAHMAKLTILIGRTGDCGLVSRGKIYRKFDDRLRKSDRLYLNKIQITHKFFIIESTL